MPKKKERENVVESVAWIENLPESGGAWGRGILDTIMAMEDEAATTDAEVDRLDAQIKELKEKSAQRRSMATQTARRATREAKKLFDGSVLERAKAPFAKATGESAAAE